MDWIKRNLYFVIGSAIALVLMGLAGWYLYSKWDLNNTILGKLEEQYQKLKDLNATNPHWGSGDVDNIKAAKDQRQQLRAFVEKSRQYYQRIAPIPMTESNKVTSQEFSTALSRTIDHLQHDASKANVLLPTNGASGRPYAFSFEYQAQNVTFAPGSLEPLAVQLGEIKAISDVLFDAKINNLDYIRRERVSDDDLKGPQDDYVGDKSTTNDLAILSPYEISFRGFSAELAAVLAGFGKSPYALAVKSVNVERLAAATSDQAVVNSPGAAQPQYVPPPQPAIPPRSAGDDYARRYGPAAGRPPAPAPQPQQPAYVAPRPASHSGLPTALDERQLKITLTVLVVKLLPPSPAK